MKHVFTLVFALIAFLANGQSVKIDSSYNNTYYQGRMELFNHLPHPKKAIVFLGNSITERGMWHELLPGRLIMNRGIGGDNTFGVLARLQAIVESEPAKVFLLIGINDLGRGLPVEVIASNYRKIIEQFKKGSPKTTLYVQSVLPMNEDLLKAPYLKNKGHLVIQLNRELEKLALEYDLPFVNLYQEFDAGGGKLSPELTLDGIHLRPAAYTIWVDFLKRKHYL